MMKELIDRHEKIVLNFSGGKDSMALLELCRPYLGKVTVVFADPGASFPHVVSFVYKVMEQYKPKEFVVVKPSIPLPMSFLKYGLPADVAPTSYSASGRFFTRSHGLKIQPWQECCNRMVWQPALDYAKSQGATLIIRGQRDSEPARGVDNGHIDMDGTEYYCPLSGWSETEVFRYIREKGLSLPEHYPEVVDSMDCYSCTALGFGGKETGIKRLQFMKEYYPLQHAEVLQNMRLIHDAAQADLDEVDSIIKGGE